MNKTLWIIIGVIVVILAGMTIWHYNAASNTGYQATTSTSTDQAVTSTVTTTTKVTTSTTSTSTKPAVAGPGQHCGGNMMNAPVCGNGYQCEPTPGSHLPFGDVGGTCVAVQVQGGAGH